MEKEFIPTELEQNLIQLGFNRNNRVYLTIENKITFCGILWQQAFDWFREKHNLGYSIHPITLDAFVTSINNAKLYMLEDNDSYTEARLACLKKLIEIVSK